MHATPTQLLIADDHPLFREALVRAIERVMPQARVDEADSVESLMVLVLAHPGAELLLLDLDIPGAHGFSALAHLRGVRPQLPVVIVSAREDQATIQRAMALGAAGFIPKSANLSVLDEALDVLLDGDEWLPPGITPHAPDDAGQTALARRVAELTPQQFRVLGMVCQGLLNKQIAWELALAPTTVKVHVSAILRKLEVGTRTQAVMLMHRLALDPASTPALPQELDEN